MSKEEWQKLLVLAPGRHGRGLPALSRSPASAEAGLQAWRLPWGEIRRGGPRISDKKEKGAFLSMLKGHLHIGKGNFGIFLAKEFREDG